MNPNKSESFLNDLTKQTNIIRYRRKVVNAQKQTRVKRRLRTKYEP